VWLGGGPIVQTSYWKLVYAVEHHNVDVKYWMIFDEPVDAGGTAGIHGLSLQEGHLETPRRAALLGADFEEIRELSMLAYTKVPDATPLPPLFLRGDVIPDGSMDIADAVAILFHLFNGNTQPSCPYAADFDDSGTIEITDAIVLLQFLFVGGPPPEPPFEECGDDGTADALPACNRGC
jgi:hypothetical protein